MVRRWRSNRRSNQQNIAIITEAEQGKAITVKVTPKNAKGTGHAVTSDPTEKSRHPTNSEKHNNNTVN